MKKLLAMLPVLVLVTAYFAMNQPVAASPNAKITLNVGQTAVVSANQCILHVTGATTALVKVKCIPGVGITTSARAALQKITLNAGQVLKIFANQCQLAVVKNKPASVKVKCNPPPADASVTVGPGGMLKYSGDVNIHVGQTVEWTWGSSNHTVTSGTGTADNLFCSPGDTNCSVASPSSSGAKYRHTFNSAGTFQYYCNVHGIQMTAKVFVSP